MYPTRHRTLALFLAATYPLAVLAAEPEPAETPAAEAAAAGEPAAKREVVVVKATRRTTARCRPPAPPRPTPCSRTCRKACAC